MSRYNNSRIFTNETNFVKERGKNSLKHHGTQILYHPTSAERSRLATNTYIWKKGDRLYNVAYAFYGDPRYWWIIAWYNGRPTEADFYPGDYVEIPINLEQTLDLLGV